MTEVISIKFKNRGKVYFFDPHGIAVRTGEKVVVETSRGLELADCTPLCRMGTAEDVADAITLLASERARFVTGQVFGVDGGLLI